MTPRPSRTAAPRTVLRVARSGAQATRALLRPDPSPLSDPWALAPAAAPRQALRRVAGLGVLALLTLVGLLVLGTLSVLLAIGVASGSDVAGWLLGLTLVLGLLLLHWAWRRAARLRLPAPATRTGTSAQEDMAHLRLLHRQARALPRPARAEVNRVLESTAAALRATSAITTLTRDAFDAQQAARTDLPDVLMAYQTQPAARRDQTLRQSLALIEARMSAIAQQGEQDAGRAAQAQHAFLQDKYEPAEDGGKGPPRR